MQCKVFATRNRHVACAFGTQLAFAVPRPCSGALTPCLNRTHRSAARSSCKWAAANRWKASRTVHATPLPRKWARGVHRRGPLCEPAASRPARFSPRAAARVPSRRPCCGPSGNPTVRPAFAARLLPRCESPLPQRPHTTTPCVSCSPEDTLGPGRHAERAVCTTGADCFLAAGFDEGVVCIWDLNAKPVALLQAGGKFIRQALTCWPTTVHASSPCLTPGRWRSHRVFRPGPDSTLVALATSMTAPQMFSLSDRGVVTMLQQHTL